MEILQLNNCENILFFHSKHGQVIPLSRQWRWIRKIFDTSDISKLLQDIGRNVDKFWNMLIIKEFAHSGMGCAIMFCKYLKINQLHSA